MTTTGAGQLLALDEGRNSTTCILTTYKKPDAVTNTGVGQRQNQVRCCTLVLAAYSCYVHRTPISLYGPIMVIHTYIHTYIHKPFSNQTQGHIPTFKSTLFLTCNTSQCTQPVRHTTSTAHNRYGTQPVRHTTSTARNQYGTQPVRHATSTAHNQYGTQPVRHTTSTTHNQWGLYSTFNMGL